MRLALPLAQGRASLVWSVTRIKRVPVVRRNKVVGIVSRANLVQALASTTLAPIGGLDNDRAIWQELLSRLGPRQRSTMPTSPLQKACPTSPVS
jgi:hypothetical protein